MPPVGLEEDQKRTWDQHLDKICRSVLPFGLIFLPKGYHVSSAPFTSMATGGQGQTFGRPGIWS